MHSSNQNWVKNVYYISITFNNPVKACFFNEKYTQKRKDINIDVQKGSEEYTLWLIVIGIPFLIRWLDYFMRILGFFEIEQKVK